MTKSHDYVAAALLDERKSPFKIQTQVFCIVDIAQICSQLFAVFEILLEKLSQNWVDFESNRNWPKLIPILCLLLFALNFGIFVCGIVAAVEMVDEVRRRHSKNRFNLFALNFGWIVARSIFVVVSFDEHSDEGRSRLLAHFGTQSNIADIKNFQILVIWKNLTNSHGYEIMIDPFSSIHATLVDNDWTFLHNDDLSTATQMHMHINFANENHAKNEHSETATSQLVRG